jgi:hypothetical protein
MRTRTTVLLLSGGLTLGLAACGGEDEITEQLTEEIIEQSDAGNVDIENDGGQMTIETEEGSMTIDSETGEMVIEGPDGEATFSSGTEVPEDVPDAPRFEGETVDGASRIEDGGQTTWTISGTLDDPEAAVEQLAADLEADGWEITNQTTMTDPEFNAFLGATKGDLEIFATAGESNANGFSWTITQTAG